MVTVAALSSGLDQAQHDVLEPLTGQESHMIVRSAGADALVYVPRGDGELAVGATVSWLRLGAP